MPKGVGQEGRPRPARSAQRGSRVRANSRASRYSSAVNVGSIPQIFAMWSRNFSTERAPCAFVREAYGFQGEPMGEGGSQKDSSAGIPRREPWWSRVAQYTHQVPGSTPGRGAPDQLRAVVWLFDR